MQRRRTKQNRGPDFTIVGAGQLARVLVHALHDAGYSISEIVSRDLPESKQRTQRLSRQVNATAAVFARAEFKAAVIWLCIPDDLVPQCAHAITRAKASWTG